MSRLPKTYRNYFFHCFTQIGITLAALAEITSNEKGYVTYVFLGDRVTEKT